ncbi:MAG: hypothetical protein DRO00_07370 [Thermoproteota archaeon]|nr:MAG: hypothetical protein DRO00_07370 [Candidatus Korarchaeota archaeon]
MVVKITDLRKEGRYLLPGSAACPGCGLAIAFRIASKVLGKNTIYFIPACCTSVIQAPYPKSAFNVPVYNVAFMAAAAAASGAVEGLKALGKKDVQVVVWAGDGGTVDIGIQALSGAFERNHDFIYICLHPDTEIVLGDGSVVKISEFVDNALLRGFKKKKEDVESVPVENDVLSWDGTKFLPKKAVYAQRKSAPREMIKITTSSGSSLILTKEHKVLIDGPIGPMWKQAKELKVGDRLYAPRRINVKSRNTPYILDLIFEVLGDRIGIQVPENIRNELKKRLRHKYGSLKEAANKLEIRPWRLIDRSRSILLSDLRKICGDTGYSWDEICKKARSMIIQGGRKLTLSNPTLNEDLCYLLGLLAAEGSFDAKSYRIAFVSKNKHLLNEFRKIHRKLFEGRAISVVATDGGATYYLISNPVIWALSEALGIKSDPKEILKLPNNLIARFIQGFFDGDGCVAITDHEHTKDVRIILSTTNELMGKRLKMMLQRLGIASSMLRGERYDVIIYSNKDILNFLTRIRSRDPEKIAKFEIIERILKRQPRGRKFDLAPEVCANLLGEICSKYNVVPSRVDPNLMQIIKKRRRLTKHKCRELLEKLSINKNDPLLEKLKNLTNDEFYLDEIKSIKKIETKVKYVYDITVKDTHVFVPEGAFVISNCYDNEAYMNTGIQKSGSTPFGAWTTTTPKGRIGMKKNMPFIVASHGAPYVATASIGYPLDLANKIEKAKRIEGPKYIHILAPCPPGWRFPMDKTIKVGKLAVDSYIWPLYEIENGRLRITMKPRRIPVEEYLKLQGRFRDLTTQEIEKIKQMVDEQWEILQKLESIGKVFP